ncbi:MAG: metallophosphoesterase [Planctomycetes bacterium]|nr:metallophosphoesterase [Planctomycetota bacterium]
MTPYLWLQTLYLGLSLGIVVALWLAAGRRASLRASCTRRTLVVAAVLGALSLLAVVLLRTLHHGHSTYVFVVIAFDFYAAMLWLPLVAGHAMWRARKLEPALAAALSACTLGGSYALWVEPDRLQVVERRLAFDAWPNEAPPLRVVHVSDFQTVGPNERQRRALELVNGLEPDVIVVTGDFISGPFWDVEPALAAAREFFGGLRAKLGVVIVDGHAERAADRERLFAGLDVRFLKNQWTRFDLGDGRVLTFYGIVTDSPDLSGLAAPRASGEVRVFLSHVPDLSRELRDLGSSGSGVDLHLAGHTHGGQIALPFLGPPMTLSELPNRYARGLHRFGEHWLHVSPGIGMEGHHAPRIRFLCPPEIDLLLLGGAEDQLSASRDVPRTETRALEPRMGER